MNKIITAIDAFNDWFGRLIAPLIAVMTLVVLYDIALRFFVGRPSDWAFDVTTMLFGTHFMLLAAYGMRHNVHVEVDVLTRLISLRKQAVLQIAGYLIFFVPFIWMFLSYGWDFAMRSWNQGETTSGMVSIPVYPVKMMLVVSGVLVLLQAVAIFIRSLRQVRGKTV